MSKAADQSLMPVVSINPLVVILLTYHEPGWLNQPREFAHESWYWRAQIQPNSNPRFAEEMHWFSPELNQGPTKLQFSEDAEIVLPSGRLKLIREGDTCKTTRE
jgi:hypothetical protein